MPSRRKQRRITTAKIVIFSAWVTIVSLMLLEQSVNYHGLMGLIGEWQFNAFGRHYPTFNYVFLIFLLCLPGYLVFLRPRPRAEAEPRDAVLHHSARAAMIAIFSAAAGLGVTALAVLIALLALPSDAGSAVQKIDLAHPPLSLPQEGPTQIAGTILFDRTAGFDEDFLLARRSYRFAPVVASRDTTNELQYFIQLPPADDRVRDGATAVTGVLKSNGLPGEIVRLFRYAGFEVDTPHYVLFMQPVALRWPYITTMIQFVVAALLALVMGLFQRVRVRRIDDAIDTRQEAGATVA